MVAGPIVLLIAVMAAPDGVALLNEAATACVQALPPGATAVVRQVPALPDEAQLGADAAAMGAAATVLVTWRNPARFVSDVRVWVRAAADGQGRTTTRTIVFSARDLPAERGRALGLVIGSILDEAWGTGVPPDSEAAERKSAAGVVASIDAEVPAPIGPLAGEARPAPNWAIEASVVTAVDRQEDLDGTIGGMIALRRTIRPHWAARAGLGLRVFDLDGVDADARVTLAELGVVWSSDGFGRPGGVGVGARIDVLGAHETIRRSAGGDPRFAEMWTLGGDVLGQVGVGLSAGTSLLLSAGVEGVLGEARLVTPDEPTAELPGDRLILELGVLSRF
jgi:opacity protein-like surface antigen